MKLTDVGVIAAQLLTRINTLFERA